MERVDKILLGTLIPVIVLILVSAVVLVVMYKPCPSNMMYDVHARKCRAKCPGEGSGGQAYNHQTQACECTDAGAPTWSPVQNKCVGQCDPGDVYNVKTKQCQPGVVDTCLPVPSVNGTTGEILDATHFPSPTDAQRCGTGTAEQLQSLCQASSCTNSAVCHPGDLWDGYRDGACYKTVQCADTACDAAYCTSATVRKALGTLHKQVVGDSCVNPSADDVGTLCNSLSNHSWHDPHCVVTAPAAQYTVSVTVTGATLNSGITGTVQHGLMNGQADGEVQYTYMLTPTTGPSVMSTPAPLELTGKCASPVMDSVCSFFKISVPPETTPGNYYLTITGFPSWDRGLPLFPTSAPTTLALRSDNDPSYVVAKPCFDAVLEKQVCDTASLVSEQMRKLQARFPSVISTIPTTLVAPAQVDADGAQPLVIPCTLDYCSVNENIAYKLVVMAWKPVSAPTPACASGDAVVRYTLRRSGTGGSDSLCSTTGQECVLIGPTAGENQPSDEEVATGIVTFIDLVLVNSNVTYTLGAYMAPTANSTLTWDFAQCRSPLCQVALSVPAYSEAECHAIEVPGKLPPYMTMASNMCQWDKNTEAQDFYCFFEAAGTPLYRSPKESDETFAERVWTTISGEDVGTSDYTGYRAAFELAQGRNVLPFPVYKPLCDLALANAQLRQHAVDFGCLASNMLSYKDKCYRLQPAYPTVVGDNPWQTLECNSFAPTDETVTLKCSQYVQLENLNEDGQLSEKDFTGRLNKLSDKFDTYKPNEAWQQSQSGIATSEEREALFTNMTACGPQTYVTEYGSEKAWCDPRDSVCSALANVANCGVNHNFCYPWVPAGNSDDAVQSPQYSRTRKCYYTSEVGKVNSKLCSYKGTYNLVYPSTPLDNPPTPFCACSPQTRGDQCEFDPCEAAFGKNQVQCPAPEGLPLRGTCTATGNTTYKCEPQYFVLHPKLGQNGFFDIYRGPGGGQNSFLIIPLGDAFGTNYTLAKFQATAGPRASTVRVEIGSGSKTDEAVVQVVLYKGYLDASLTKGSIVYTWPPPTGVAYRDADRTVERKHDGVVDLSNWVVSGLIPGSAYTLAVLIQFLYTKGTDDEVRIYYPTTTLVTTLSSGPY